MDLTQLFDWHEVMNAALVGAGAYVVSWARKVNCSIEDTVKSAALLHEKLSGHEDLDDERFAEVHRRLDDVHGGRYDRR